ncbi:hypothetical protein SAMN06265173_10978 [Thalassovita litoralis]|jgi:hypothetical protein|uniref:Lipoprotein n=1 Tax=Thalassovita litoralis TaxID=1010611 RepID=A0A521D7N4_9RHOB|nr:hypothetical protein [Thalassovita litoralis]SMO67703.1 hypothetical protein SAMN06265173_10978 [Thalassovita litoralis]
MRKWLLVLAAVSLTAGCAVKQDPPVTDEQIINATYRHDAPPELTLYTMINNQNGSGAHTSLMINASQRVIFDPAGSFRDKAIVARNDVVYGVTPYVEDVYTRFHARKTYHVVIQRLQVTPEVAEQALRLAQGMGEIGDGQCASSTSRLLSQLPGLNIQQTMLPKKLMAQFGDAPLMSSRSLYEYDDEDRFKALREYDPEKAKASFQRIRERDSAKADD